jgi:ribosome-binding protein aMBF1 (putative translation factor)
MQFNEEKIAKLKRADEHFDERYGKQGTAERADFEVKSQSWYYIEILKEARKKEKLTQKQLADKIGLERSYIAHIERGETDMQLSSFLRITGALGLNFSLQP